MNSEKKSAKQIAGEIKMWDKNTEVGEKVNALLPEESLFPFLCWCQAMFLWSESFLCCFLTMLSRQLKKKIN